MAQPASDISAILSVPNRASEQNDELFRLVQRQFYSIANRLLRNENAANSLQETMLVNDSFMQLIRGKQQVWETRADFFARAAQIMRHILVDHARARLAQKRGSGQKPDSLQSSHNATDNFDPNGLIELNEVLEKLQSTYPDSFCVFDLHYFMGYQLQEIANDILEIPYITVRRRWKAARAFLRDELIGDQ